jgi:YfiH family protein
LQPEILVPDWPAPTCVRALVTTRRGGISRGVYQGFNLGSHVGDEPSAVAANRRLLQEMLPSEPRWTAQVHGTAVARWTGAQPEGRTEADAACTAEAKVVCAMLTADCLPVFFCDREGQTVGVAHAGWRGLANGVLEATLDALRGLAPSAQWMAYLGPAIGPDAFEVGEEVRTAFIERDAGAQEAFRPGVPGKWFADLYALARRRLRAAGVEAIYGGDACTYTDAHRFYSHRRATVSGEERSGRMASLIWLDRER